MTAAATTAPATLRDLLEPSVDALGYELLHLEFAAQSGRNILRVYIDAPGGIRVDDCEAVSRQLSAVLDVEESPNDLNGHALSGAFDLEVSSPGLDRPLVTPEHFRRHTGSRARIVMHAAESERKNFTGEVLDADDRRVVLRIDGERRELTYDQMRMARLEPEFDAAFSRRRT